MSKPQHEAQGSLWRRLRGIFGAPANASAATKTAANGGGDVPHSGQARGRHGDLDDVPGALSDEALKKVSGSRTM